MAEETPKSSPDPIPTAVEQVAKAHRRLLALRDELDRHPELERAIVELEMALNALTIKTGGLL
jgi:GrpB-like predicted nucleotidyltransferase (UPF0157 family)